MEDGEFKLADVLSTYTGIMLVHGGMDGIYKVLNYLTGESLYTHQLPRAADSMKETLRKQVEFLDSPDFDIDVGRLELMLKTASGKKDPGKLCLGWLCEQQNKHGYTVMLSPSHEAYEAQNPIAEL